MTPAYHEVNVLLVDDRPERLLSYEVALEELGYNSVRALSGAAALGLLMEMEFAAILLDVNMPDMNGFETAALIRDHPRFEKTPIIFVTGLQVNELDQRRGYEMGAVDYVQVPVIPEILRGKVQALVQLYLQRAELSRLNRQLGTANAQLGKAHAEQKAKNTLELKQINQVLEKANGELLATNGRLTREIAERRRVEEALSDSARRKDEYIAILAHELRNPLSAISNAVQAMQVDDPSEKQRVWAQELLQRQVQHLTCLMDDLLEVSRIKSGRIQLRTEVVELSKLVRHVTETVAPLLDKHQHALRMQLPDKPVYVEGDAVRLAQILSNLLTNAAKYMDDGGIIELFLEQEGDKWIVVRVRDYGVGIPTELLDRIFDPFVQAPNALNRAQGGLGIGLALVKTLVELQGGITEVSSEGLGCGAQFTVRFPLVEAPNDTTATPVTSPSVSKPTRQQRILIIDDNADSNLALAICLQAEGYELHTRFNGGEGLAAALELCPDFVLLDIGLPDMDGYEIAQKLRQHESLAATPIIAMTGYSGKTERSRAKAAGFDHYLVKPVYIERLLSLLREST